MKKKKKKRNDKKRGRSELGSESLRVIGRGRRENNERRKCIKIKGGSYFVFSTLIRVDFIHGILLTNE